MLPYFDLWLQIYFLVPNAFYHKHEIGLPTVRQLCDFMHINLHIGSPVFFTEVSCIFSDKSPVTPVVLGGKLRAMPAS